MAKITASCLFLFILINSYYFVSPYLVVFDRTNREAGQNVTIDGIKIPKGMRVDIAVAAIHYDQEIYPDPEKFIPER